MHGFDTARLVVTGDSSGSHLALTTGLLEARAGFESGCEGPEPPPVAAIVNWFGVTDLADVFEGANKQALPAVSDACKSRRVNGASWPPSSPGFSTPRSGCGQTSAPSDAGRSSDRASRRLTAPQPLSSDPFIAAGLEPGWRYCKNERRCGSL
jgi:hypothetical protein